MNFFILADIGNFCYWSNSFGCRNYCCSSHHIYPADTWSGSRTDSSAASFSFIFVAAFFSSSVTGQNFSPGTVYAKNNPPSSFRYLKLSHWPCRKFTCCCCLHRRRTFQPCRKTRLVVAREGQIHLYRFTEKPWMLSFVGGIEAASWILPGGSGVAPSGFVWGSCRSGAELGQCRKRLLPRGHLHHCRLHHCHCPLLHLSQNCLKDS